MQEVSEGRRGTLLPAVARLLAEGRQRRQMRLEEPLLLVPKPKLETQQQQQQSRSRRDARGVEAQLRLVLLRAVG